ncbi:CBS domain containing-hemolysin-like protein [Geomicrobium halophilum]|uniref:CBS domain containing-hemolysin-like protein n=1 Tax=Geomicrobium halophilum TaxID=549000 RepID=A0A841PRT7_9BACL|nr:hemolysin family protein [Geomicrobium halophilum]MBB6449876.1 CBS domain containing-hemolysin-like protein [Geomicrobium halophilum]
MSIGINTVLFFLLLVATAVFVAAEFSIVRLSSSRLDQLVEEGNAKAKLMKKVTNNLDDYIAACQLGSTVTAIGLGWLGEPVVETLLAPLFSLVDLSADVMAPVSFIVAFILVLFLRMVVGELAPRTAAIQRPEGVSFFLIRWLRLFYMIVYPILYVLNGITNAFVQMFGLKPAKELDEAHTEEELQVLLTESLKHGEINQAEFGYVNNIFAFDERKADEIMVPRPDMVCLYRDEPYEESIAKIQEKRFTRFPVVGSSKDDIVGFINTKQFLLLNVDEDNINLSDITRSVLTVSDQTPIKRLLKKMQTEGAHLAILIDEYGGTAGMVTIEDILEEIVGDIRDEFDEGEMPEIEEVADNHFLVDGIVLIDDINQHLPNKIEEEEFDTIGGWLFSMNPNIREGEKWKSGTLKIRVIKRDEYRYRKLELIVEDENEE